MSSRERGIPAIPVLALGFFTLGFCADSAHGTGDPTLEALLAPGLERGYPGVAVLIESCSGGVRSAAAGHADLERPTPMKPTTPSRW